jgi:hypothetical protein
LSENRKWVQRVSATAPRLLTNNKTEERMMNPDTITTIIRGCIAKEMGYVDQRRVGTSADEVVKFLKTLTLKEFSQLKKS